MAVKMKMTARNAAFQRFETLKRNREKRHRQRLAFVEGVHPFEQAILNGWAFDSVGFPAGKRLSGWAHDMLGKASIDTLYEIEPALMDELSEREESCELIGLVKMREDALWRMAQRAGENPLYLVFDRPQGPGNLGTVLRSADAFSAAGVFTTGHSADFYDPLCIRASIGACFHLPFYAMENMEKMLKYFDGLPVRPKIIGTSAKGTDYLSRMDLTGPTVLLIGNETFGLSKGWKERADHLARIPIFGAASSLNAGCAASICLYEAARQRGIEG